MILDSSFYRVRKLTSNAYITYRFDDRLVMRHFIPCTSAILYTIANPVVWVANPTRGCYALAGVQLPERCAGNVQFSSRRVPYNRGMSRLAKNFAKMLSALQQLQEELPAAHSLHNHSEDDHSEDMSR